MIVLKDNLNLCKFLLYKLGTFSYIINGGFGRLWSLKDLHLPLTTHLIALSSISILPLNIYLNESPIVKLHHSQNINPSQLVVTDEIAVLNHAKVMQFRHESVKKSLVKVKNVVYDGREHKSICLSKMGRRSTIACHSPSSFFESFFISQPKFRTMIVLKDSLNLCKFVPYKIGTFS